MSIPLDSNRSNLLSRLHNVSQNPITPTLFQRLSSPSSPPTLTPSPELSARLEPILLKRMRETRPSRNLNQLSKLSEGVMLQKRARSPQSLEYLKTTPMSHSANLKRRQPSTPTLLKSFPFNPPLTIQEDMIPLDLNPSILQLNLEKLTPEKPPRDNKTSKIQHLTMKTANLAKNRSYSKATCYGSPHPMTLLSPIATPVAK